MRMGTVKCQVCNKEFKDFESIFKHVDKEHKNKNI